MIKILADKPEQKASLRKAFIKFKRAITNPQKNSDNPFTKSRYVDLAAVLEVIAKGEDASGLAFTQDVGTDDQNRLFCRSILMGDNGSIVSSAMAVPVGVDSSKRGSQEYGSAETYVRRYSAQSLCGFAGKDEDDDGNASTFKRRSQSSRYSGGQSAPRRSDSNDRSTAGQQKWIKKLVRPVGEQLTDGEADKFNKLKANCGSFDGASAFLDFLFDKKKALNIQVK